MTFTCSRALSADNIAQGSEPSAPPCAAAMTSSASIAPAIGASTIGNSVLNRSINRRSGHMVIFSLLNRLVSLLRDLEVPPAHQDLIGLSGNPIDNLGSRRNVMDQTDALAGKDARNIEITGVTRSRIFRRDRVQILNQLDLPSRPAPRVIVDQGAPGKGGRPP